MHLRATLLLAPNCLSDACLYVHTSQRKADIAMLLINAPVLKTEPFPDSRRLPRALPDQAG
jgi:hypothetical protein